MKLMKSILLHGWLAALVAATMAGCATDPSRVSVAAVGPLNGTPLGSLGSGQGTLRVFTQSQAMCSVYTQAGKLVERLPNSTTNEDVSPRELKLPAGQYLVSVPTSGYGQVTVPVVIVVNEVTPLYLNRSGMSNKDALPDAELSRLPDGRIAGRSAYPPPPPAPKVPPSEKPKP